MIPPEVLNELHAALKEAERYERDARDAWNRGAIETGESLREAAAMRYQNLTARCLVTLLATITPPAPAMAECQRHAFVGHNRESRCDTCGQSIEADVHNRARSRPEGTES